MQWTPEKLETLLDELRLHRGDTTSIEVKTAAGGLPKTPETICAFANMPKGGTIILGVDEAAGRFKVSGVTDVATLEAGLASTARQAVDPPPTLHFQTLKIGDKDVLITNVDPLSTMDKPAFVGGKAYLRQSDGDYQMHAHELRMLEVEKLNFNELTNFDAAAVQGGTPDDLESELVHQYIETVRTSDRRLREATDTQILRVTNVMTGNGEPTLAGLYALGFYPQGYAPALTVTAAVQLKESPGQARVRNLSDFTGPIPVLLEDIMDWFEANLDQIYRYREDGHMVTESELPLNALRELVANALVHRNLGPSTLDTGKSIQIRLTHDRLFIQSPGGLHGISLEQLESAEHAQAAVNQRLYQIAKRLRTSDGVKVIEGEGGGIREVFEAMAARGLRRPLLVDTGVQFTATLWRNKDITVLRTPTDSRAAAEDISAHVSAILPKDSEDRSSPAIPRSSSPTINEPRVLSALFHSTHPLSVSMIADATGLDIRQIRYALKRPLEEGLVKRNGGQGSKKTTYQLRTP